MLTLRNIKKDYAVGGQMVPALRGVDLTFGDTEFVSILGQSGSGKTTLLNIIGGLDRYTSGDLLVDGRSTQDFKDNDWDAYRNTTIGFVFQTYNLITHLSVLDNVEMSLRLAGINAKERRERAINVLTEVGLKDHMFKKPNQLSGGQMQRVAIARALINNPKVLLADEPTGALDSKTSTQIMKLIQQISKGRLVIMVTHNAELASHYSDRIIKLADGLVVEDSQDQTLGIPTSSGKLITPRTSMSFMTALNSSFKNLLTKKGRTTITAFAGSIGIIGIALVLSISSGMTDYVNVMQSDTLAGFPLTINQTVVTREFGPGGMLNQDDPAAEFPSDDVVYSYDSQASTTTHTNLFTDEFLTFIDELDTTTYNSISYSYALSMQMVAETSTGAYVKTSAGTSPLSFFGSASVYSEMPDSEAFILTQYDVLSGTLPQDATELALVVDSQNRVDIATLNALGIDITEDYSFATIVGETIKVIPNDVYYTDQGSTFIPNTDYQSLYNDPRSISLEIAGILRVKPEASSELLSTGIVYTTDLTEMMLQNAGSSAVVEAQLDSPTVNVLTGFPFNTQVTYTSVIRSLGGETVPSSISIYPTSFDSKDAIKASIDSYNEDVSADYQIVYTDVAETISSTIGTLISTITLILGAFAAISLVVSSIMIGIITYVSVIERTKEIGIMRSLGARKKDISRIFNAETFLIGLSAGLLGIGLTLVLLIPTNLVLAQLIGVTNFGYLSPLNSLLLVVLSTILTLIAGLIPSGIAARQDPVVALRTE